MLELNKKENGELELIGRLDAAQADKLKSAMDDIEGDVRLDLEKLEYVSSAGLGVFIGTHSRLEKDGYKLTLIRPSSHVLTVLRLSRLDQVLTIVENS